MEYIHLNDFAKDANFPFFIQFGKHDGYMPIHYHVDFSELVIVLKGTATHIVNSEKYFIKKGDVFVINKNTFHGYEDAIEFRICNIMYIPQHLSQVDTALRKLPGYQALFVIEPSLAREYNFKSKLQLMLSDYERTKAIISDMIDEYEEQYQGYETMIYARFIELIVFLSRRYDIVNSGLKDNVINLAKALSYMENHFQEHISLNELADKAELSARHFNRIFKENYRITPMNYLIRLRIQYACLLLRKSSLRISDIAFESGFEDSNYFTRLFKKIMGILPRDYRSNRDEF